MFSQLTGKDPFYRKNVSTIFPDITANKLPGHDGKDITEVSTQFGDRIYRISMQKVFWESLLHRPNSDGYSENNESYCNVSVR